MKICDSQAVHPPDAPMDRLQRLSYTPPVKRPKKSAGIRAAELRAALDELQKNGPLELFEEGEMLAELHGMKWEVREQGADVFLHCWSDERNWNRRVLDYAADEGRVTLEVQRFGRSRPGRAEVSPAVNRAAPRLTREKFKARLRRLLAEQFPDEQVEAISAAPDLEHSFSGTYVRGTMRRAGEQWAFIAASPAESAQAWDAILTAGLLWLDWVREHAERVVTSGLRVVLPQETAAPTVHRLRALADWARVQVFETDEALGALRRIDAEDTGNLRTWLAPHREVLAVREAARDAIENIMRLAPEAIDVVVRALPSGRAQEVYFRFRGLEFARWSNGRLECARLDADTTPEWAALSGANDPLLQKTVQQLSKHRSVTTAARHHPLYRAVAERWLESLVLRDLTRIDPQLDAAFCYPQVPALAPPATSNPLGAGGGVIDVLSVTRQGRLAVIELKADEDMHLAMQGADYWLRVRWHQRQGDFQRCGYFSGRELQDQPPLLILAAPGLRFHPATDVLLKYLSPEIEVRRVGLNEEWRNGLKVVFRQ